MEPAAEDAAMAALDAATEASEAAAAASEAAAVASEAASEAAVSAGFLAQPTMERAAMAAPATRILRRASEVIVSLVPNRRLVRRPRI